MVEMVVRSSNGQVELSVRFMVCDKQNIRISMGRGTHAFGYLVHTQLEQKETRCQSQMPMIPSRFPLPRHVQNML